MRIMTIALGLMLALFLSSPGAAAPPELPVDPLSVNVGPFVGVVEDGTNTHHYQNAPSGTTCIALASPYLVTIESTGPVQVSVGSYTTTVNGYGSLSFTRGVCTAFDIEVAGTGTLAGYAIEVVGGPAAGGICNGCIALA